MSLEVLDFLHHPVLNAVGTIPVQCPGVAPLLFVCAQGDSCLGHQGAHPSGQATLKRYGAVFCDGQGEHLQILLVGGWVSKSSCDIM